MGKRRKTGRLAMMELVVSLLLQLALLVLCICAIAGVWKAVRVSFPRRYAAVRTNGCSVDKIPGASFADVVAGRWPPLRIHLLPMPREFGDELIDREAETHDPRDYHNTHFHYFSDLEMHRQLRHYPHLVDASDADTFYVPVYSSFLGQDDSVARFVAWLVNESGFWQRRNGMDHLASNIVYIDWDWWNSIPYHPRKCNLNLIIGTEGFDWDWEHWEKQSWRKLQLFVMPFITFFPLTVVDEGRRIFNAFLSQLHSGGKDVKAVVRRLIEDALGDVPRAYILNPGRGNRKPMDKIGEGLARGRFCPVGIGDAPASKRLYDAIRMGCVPILASDRVMLPYENLLINWSWLWQVPQLDIGRVLREVILNATEDQYLRARAGMAATSRVLNVRLGGAPRPGEQLWAFLWAAWTKRMLLSPTDRSTLVGDSLSARDVCVSGEE